MLQRFFYSTKYCELHMKLDKAIIFSINYLLDWLCSVQGRAAVRKAQAGKLIRKPSANTAREMLSRGGRRGEQNQQPRPYPTDQNCTGWLAGSAAVVVAGNSRFYTGVGACIAFRNLICFLVASQVFLQHFYDKAAAIMIVKQRSQSIPYPLTLHL